MHLALTLLLDIDDTVVRGRADVEPPEPILQHALLALIRDYATEHHGKNKTDVLRVIEEVYNCSPWWDWNDYLDALTLDRDSTWSHLDDQVSQWLEPQDINLRSSLQTLVNQGHRVVITSNNPTSGIRHKLRIAGFDTPWQNQHIAGYMGTDVIQATKHQPEYWQRVLERIDTNPETTIVIGDNPHDDFEIPVRAGLRRYVLIEPSGKPLIDMTDIRERGIELIEVADWADLLNAVTQHAHSHERAGFDSKTNDAM